MPRARKADPGVDWRDAGAGWVDKRMPDLQDLLGPHPEVDVSQFAEWLGDRLGYYRASTAASGALPSAGEERATAAGLDLAASSLAHALGAGLTPNCDARLTEAAHAVGADWQTFRQGLLMQLRLLRLYTAGASVALDAESSRAGRPPALARDALVAAVVARPRLHMKADPARHLAQQVLQRCGVPMPASTASGTDAVKRAARKGGQKPR